MVEKNGNELELGRGKREEKWSVLELLEMELLEMELTRVEEMV